MRAPSSRSAGFSLVEVLMALLLLSVGVLGLVRLQASASRASVDAEDRTRAALLAEDLISTMWLKGTSSLDSTTLAAWAARLSDTSALGLPGTPGYSVTTTGGVTTVTVTWQEPGRVTSVGTAASSQYKTSVVIP